MQKNVRIRSLSGQCFPTFGPNTEIYSVLRIYSITIFFAEK